MNLINSKYILITGGCGFIGVNIVNYLLRKGFDHIRILDNLSTGTRENLEDALKDNGEIIRIIKNKKIIYKFKKISSKNIQNNITVDLIIGDIRSYEMCLKSTENINTVIHLAAHAGVIRSIEDPFYDFEVNVQGTLNLLYAAVKNKVDKFIFASSNAPLGDQNPPMNEKKVPKPLSPYGASKLACEGYCSAFYNSFGLKTASLRFSNVYGPYCLHKNSVIAKFIKDGIVRGKLTVYGDGQQTRDFIHVEDLCHAIFLAQNHSIVQSSNLNNIWGNVFHLGTRKETSILELVKLIKRFFKRNINISYYSERKGEIKRNYSDISKAQKALDFYPQISLIDGVKAVYKWFENKGTDQIKIDNIRPE